MSLFRKQNKLIGKRQKNVLNLLPTQTNCGVKENRTKGNNRKTLTADRQLKSFIQRIRLDFCVVRGVFGNVN